MLNKNFRLLTNFEFNITRKYGQKYSGQFFSIFILKPKNPEKNPRVGLVVSNKFHKNAVCRNKIKRRFRQIVKTHFDKIKNNVWVVIHPRPNSLDQNYENLSADYIKTIQKVSFTR